MYKDAIGQTSMGTYHTCTAASQATPYIDRNSCHQNARRDIESGFPLPNEVSLSHESDDMIVSYQNRFNVSSSPSVV